MFSFAQLACCDIRAMCLSEHGFRSCRFHGMLLLGLVATLLALYAAAALFSIPVLRSCPVLMTSSIIQKGSCTYQKVLS